MRCVLFERHCSKPMSVEYKETLNKSSIGECS